MVKPGQIYLVAEMSSWRNDQAPIYKCFEICREITFHVENEASSRKH